MERYRENLGAPDLRIAGFQLWVRGRRFEDQTDYWNGNWLQVVAHCGANGASVWVEGPILMAPDVARFTDQCSALNEHLAGRATLDSVEPNLRVRVAIQDRTGHLALRVEITPDQLDQEHTFAFSLDQSYLPGILAQCRRVLASYPVRGHPAA